MHKRLNTFKMESTGMETRVVHDGSDKNGYTVTLWDTDSGLDVGFTLRYNDWTSAVEKAKEVLIDNAFGCSAQII